MHSLQLVVTILTVKNKFNKPNRFLDQAPFCPAIGKEILKVAMLEQALTKVWHCVIEN